jgi:PTS system mannose-specific IIB component
VVDKPQYEVIAGVNIPMLVETLMARDDNPGFDELVAVAVETGREGVKALKAKEEAPAPAAVKPAAAVQPAKPMAPGDHMKIGLTRIDDRLIHGQVATRWTKETNVQRIIVVSDEVANDHVRKTLLTQVAPPGVTAHVVDVDKMVRVWNNPKYGQDRVMLLFTNPTDVLRVVEQGVDIKTVNIGGMAFRQGKTQVNNAVSVDEKDIAAFRKLNERNIELEVRKVSSDQKLKMMDLIAKVNA